MKWKDNAEIGTIDCPNGHAVALTVGEMRRDEVLTCAECGAAIHLQGGKDSAEQVERIIRDAFKGFGRRR